MRDKSEASRKWATSIAYVVANWGDGKGKERKGEGTDKGGFSKEIYGGGGFTICKTPV